MRKMKHLLMDSDSGEIDDQAEQGRCGSFIIKKADLTNMSDVLRDGPAHEYRCEQ